MIGWNLRMTREPVRKRFVSSAYAKSESVYLLLFSTISRSDGPGLVSNWFLSRPKYQDRSFVSSHLPEIVPRVSQSVGSPLLPKQKFRMNNAETLAPIWEIILGIQTCTHGCVSIRAYPRSSSFYFVNISLSQLTYTCKLIYSPVLVGISPLRPAIGDMTRKLHDHIATMSR